MHNKSESMVSLQFLKRSLNFAFIFFMFTDNLNTDNLIT